jgi:5-aminopentanamidase
VQWCEANEVAVLCCPEAILGGLADYTDSEIAIEARQLAEVLAPLASDRVTTIIGFTEREGDRLFNSAAVFHKGEVLGVYRKLHPAINRSVYEPGSAMPVFAVGKLTFGVMICRDSNFEEPARVMAAQGATILFVPTNNGLPKARARPEIVAEARAADVARARENGVYVVRADVAGESESLKAFGTSAIVDPDGVVIASADPSRAGLLVAHLPFQ